MKLFSPKDFFLQIAAFAALYVSVVSLLTLLFQYINALFPDELDQFVDPFSGAVRFAMATLIIVFPLYILFTRLVNQELRRSPEKRDGGLRKWLIYITLFIAGATLAGDLIVLINTFLGGEITVRFVLKVLSILIVVGAGFGYYFYDLRGKWSANESASKGIGAVVSVIVLASIVGGFFIIGSPQTQREFRLDLEREQDLQSIQWQIVNFWQQKEVLPQSLAELEDPLIGLDVPQDPATGEAYGYRTLGARTFELCAVFNRESQMQFERPSLARDVFIDGKGFSSTWEHGAGETCFERTIDPELFPPRSAQ